MEIVFNSFLPEEDELLESWIYRLAQANCMDYYDMVKLINDNDENTKRINVPRLLDMPPIDIECSTLINEHTLIPFRSFFQTQEEVDKMYRYYLYPETHEINKVNPNIPQETHVCLCKECCNEDSFPYIHRMHNMPGVSVCPKHGAPLYIAKTVFKKTIFEIGAQMLSENTEGDTADSEYCRTILDSNIVVKRDAMLKTLGVSERDLYWKDWSKDRVLYELKHRYPNASELVNILRTSTHKYPMMLNKQFKELSFDDGIWKLKHRDCKTVFYTTPTSFSDDYQCPVCDSEMGETEFAEKVVNTKHDREYMYDHSSDVDEGKLVVIHKKCGKKSYFNLDRFLAGKCRCECNVSDKEELETIIEEWGDFSIVEFHNRYSKIVVEDNTTGKRFSFESMDKLEKPAIHSDEKPIYTANEAKAKAWKFNGEEFVMIHEKDIFSEDEIVEYRHIPCGKVYKERFSDFIWGGYCPECEVVKDLEKLKKYVIERSEGRYKIVDDDLLHPGRVAIKDVFFDEGFKYMKPSEIVHELAFSRKSTQLPIDAKGNSLNPVYADRMQLGTSKYRKE